MPDRQLQICDANIKIILSLVSVTVSHIIHVAPNRNYDCHFCALGHRLIYLFANVYLNRTCSNAFVCKITTIWISCTFCTNTVHLAQLTHICLIIALYSNGLFQINGHRTSDNVQDCFHKKEAECTLAALEFLIAWGKRLAFALVKYSNIIMKEIC